MRYPVLTIRRRDLVAAGACAEWLAAFDAAIAERDLERVPLEPHADGTPRYGVRPVERGPVVRRRDGSTYRDADRLRIELSPLAQVWLSLPVAPHSGTAWTWLRNRGVVGAQNLYGADLRGANLSRANLRGADLCGADLSRANLYGADLTGTTFTGATFTGAKLTGADLTGADLSAAKLTGADLTGAYRRTDDPAITGWTVRDGRLERAS